MKLNLVATYLYTYENEAIWVLRLGSMLVSPLSIPISSENQPL